MSQAAAVTLSPTSNEFSLPPLVLYVLLHLGCLGVLYTGFSMQAATIFVFSYLFRVFAPSLAYHRYFAHRTFKTSRAMQFLLGVYGSTAVQGGPLWWSQTHREHHQHADTPDDIHSPRFQGFFYSHSGWFLKKKHRTTDYSKVRDLAKFPELVWLEKWYPIVIGAFVGVIYLVLGVVGVVWGFFGTTVLILHMTHWVQSVSHSIGGYRRYPTLDNSRNHWLFGLVSMGEGFHHNHHYCPSSARLGLYWWEIDVSYYLLRVLNRCGLIWDLKEPDEDVKAGHHPRCQRHLLDLRSALERARDRAVAILDGSVRPSEEDLRRDERTRIKHALNQEIRGFLDSSRANLVRGPAAFAKTFTELRQRIVHHIEAFSLECVPEKTARTAVIRTMNEFDSGLRVDRIMYTKREF